MDKLKMLGVVFTFIFVYYMLCYTGEVILRMVGNLKTYLIKIVYNEGLGMTSLVLFVTEWNYVDGILRRFLVQFNTSFSKILDYVDDAISAST